MIIYLCHVEDSQTTIEAGTEKLRPKDRKMQVTIKEIKDLETIRKIAKRRQEE